ncbi:recombinase family protein [uncultured Desulfobacter sp.]|uniref:recombinase family protein n=1 Tax=uncultured Desulfobacter sp. TaxID=240139 RepID=UPI0029C9646D|nr:recombinase family protein [uncultured Desulfobacter sp.]
MDTIQSITYSTLNSHPGKIQSHHHNRLAMVYIRQSTLQQVERHSESTKLQYALVEKACDMGWPREQVVVVDDDLGISGANAEGRPGFQRLVAEVSLDHVGIIFGIEMSRLARSCRDWHQLLEVCSLFCTLIADTEGVYDPCNHNDRLLLGLKGTLSEAELHVIKQRMLAGKKAKARRGELGMQLAMGYVKHPSGEIIKDPDEQAQSTIDLIFTLFERYRTINGVLKHLVKNNIQMPHRIRGGMQKGELEWRRPNRVTLSNLLHNPIYAGAYVYGRRPTDPRKKKPGRPSTGRVSVKPEEWEVLIHNKFPGYIPWQVYERNQRQLKMNSSQGIGTPKHGPSLLSGLVICGRCGLRMATCYSSQGHKLRYSCNRMAVDYGDKSCQSLLGAPLDQLIQKEIMAAIQPSALELSLQAAANIEQEREQQQRHWQQRLERAHYESERGYRQYNAVEPENRLVARTLERKWEEALSAETKLNQDYEKYLKEQPNILTETERLAIQSLASDIPHLWKAESTTREQRQQIIRLLIDRIIVTVQGNTEKVHVCIHWKGGCQSEANFNRPVAKLEQLSYYKELIERVSDLYKQGNSHKAIADILNDEKWQSAKQRGQYNGQMVRTLLLKNGVVSKKKKRSNNVLRKENEVTLSELSQKTQIPEPTLYKWMRDGKLKARKDTTVSHNGVWLIKADKNEIKRLLEYRDRPKQWIYRSRVKKVD